MQRYFAKNKNLDLLESDIHHIKNVIRMKKNSKFNIIFDNVLYMCIIEDINKKTFKYKVLEKQVMNIESNKVTIGFPLIKEKNLSIFLQKATELNAEKILLLNTERTIVKSDKIDRYVNICKEASEQSHRSSIPSIEIINLKDIVKYKKQKNIYCNVNETSINIKEVINKKIDDILIVIGPEGGFSNNEINFFEENDFISVYLTKTILRSETAGIYVLSIINYEVDDE